MLVAQNSLGPVCPVPLTVRGTGRWADPLGDAIKAARAWCRERCGGGDADAAEKEPLVAVTVDRSASRDDDAEG
jgi:hypothetical protein